MSVIHPYGGSYGFVSGSVLATGKSQMALPLMVVATQRNPTDPYFYASVTINGAVIGSRYWLVNNSDHSQVLSTGLITSDPQVLPNIPSYGSPMLMLLRLRNASNPVKYKTYESTLPHSSVGSSFYCAQVEDE